MSYITWANSKVKKFDWLDVGCTKWSAGIFMLMVAKLWPPILSLNWYWYLIIALLIAIRPFKTMFFK